MNSDKLKREERRFFWAVMILIVLNLTNLILILLK